MTMADTVAVMHAGLIEQKGAPADLYDNPATTFVANFLGQSNLVEGEIRTVHGNELEVDVQGKTIRVPAERARVDSGKVWVGVRPEKVVVHSEVAATDATNSLPRGRVIDVSFSGVSTQYLVRMPWGQELTIFEQNTGSRPLLHVGDEVDLRWRPEHTFLLDAAQDASAGVQDPLVGT